METKIEPRWWKRDPDTGKMIMGGEVITTRFYPVTTAAFTRDWSVEGNWKPNPRRYLPFGRLSISMALLKRNKWRME